MEKKWIIVAVVAAAIAIAGAVAFLMLSSDKEWETTPDDWLLDRSVGVGDWIEFDNTEYKVVSVSGDKYEVKVSKGYSTSYKDMTKKEFLSLLTSKEQLKVWAEAVKIDYSLNYEKTQSISTYLGTKECKVYTGTATGTVLGTKTSFDFSVYIGAHGICYRIVANGVTHEMSSSLWFPGS